ncbi:hypothetical protein [Schlesneria paludicola]|uniref:hypothetical protein n=1 Tax=Schlesneria paludicola TaxID=360056 RepID=UPI0003002E91|nr:hypothetical protein [Schlesneria paludicola]
MKRREFLVFSLVLFGMTGSLFAADADPTGTWKWSVTNPKNNKTREQSVKLKLDGGKLTGTVPGAEGKEIDIENATYKDGEISFSVTRERNGQKVVTKFSGKLEGDSIKGKFEGERANGKGQGRDWVAQREKA